VILIRPISAQGRTKTQLLMYKTTVYTLVITAALHIINSKYQKKVILHATQHGIA